MAERLRLDPLQAKRIERRGLRRLLALDRAGTCGVAGDGTAAGSSSTAIASAARSDAGGGPSGTDGTGTEGAEGGVKGVAASGARDDQSGGSSGDFPLPVEEQSVAAGLLLLAIALGVLVFAVRREVRRH